MGDWKQNLVNDNGGIEQMLRQTKTIAVLGIKPETHADQAAHYVPAHMAAAGRPTIGPRGATRVAVTAPRVGPTCKRAWMAPSAHSRCAVETNPPPARQPLWPPAIGETWKSGTYCARSLR